MLTASCLIKQKLLQNKIKTGAKSTEKTKEVLTWAKSQGIKLWVGDQRLMTLNVDNLIKRKVSFSVIEKRNITSPLNVTFEMRQKDDTTVIKKKPTEALFKEVD